MQLQVGKTYQSHRPAETIDLDGEIIQFQGETFTFTVLPKPDEVTAVTVDIHGEERERVKLPRHLQKGVIPISVATCVNGTFPHIRMM